MAGAHIGQETAARREQHAVRLDLAAAGAAASGDESIEPLMLPALTPCGHARPDELGLGQPPPTQRQRASVRDGTLLAHAAALPPPRAPLPREPPEDAASRARRRWQAARTQLAVDGHKTNTLAAAVAAAKVASELGCSYVQSPAQESAASADGVRRASRIDADANSLTQHV